MRLAILAGIVYVPMLAEALRAARNERAQLARGGVEPPGDVYRIMRMAYPGLFAAMLAEGFVRGPAADGWWVAGLIVFALGKALKWWAILALGPAWTFKVVVVTGDRLVATGPYKFLRHPNYLGVLFELAGTAFALRAYVSGPLAIVLFGSLMAKRISVENRALARSAP
jgi:methyltransferase